MDPKMPEPQEMDPKMLRAPMDPKMPEPQEMDPKLPEPQEPNRNGWDVGNLRGRLRSAQELSALLGL